MPRTARKVVPNKPHHVIQRGNRSQTVFFCDPDRKFYLNLLRKRCEEENVLIWAYCLMDNHIHLTLIPPKENSLSDVMGDVHRYYTMEINKKKNWKGYLWQGRFLSFPMDNAYLQTVIRYIELNPVKAGIVQRPDEYPWSSAHAHIWGTPDPLLSPCPLEEKIRDWSAYLTNKKSAIDDLKDNYLDQQGKHAIGKKPIRQLARSLGIKI